MSSGIQTTALRSSLRTILVRDAERTWAVQIPGGLSGPSAPGSAGTAGSLGSGETSPVAGGEAGTFPWSTPPPSSAGPVAGGSAGFGETGPVEAGDEAIDALPVEARGTSTGLASTPSPSRTLADVGAAEGVLGPGAAGGAVADEFGADTPMTLTAPQGDVTPPGSTSAPRSSSQEVGPTAPPHPTPAGEPGPVTTARRRHVLGSWFSQHSPSRPGSRPRPSPDHDTGQGPSGPLSPRARTRPTQGPTRTRPRPGSPPAGPSRHRPTQPRAPPPRAQPARPERLAQPAGP